MKANSFCSRCMTPQSKGRKFSKKDWTKDAPFDIMIHADHANVAQSVEQLIRNQQVRGSSPLIGSSTIEV